jgi:RNA polymerase sigma-70 factor (ECF subfamily)
LTPTDEQLVAAHRASDCADALEELRGRHLGRVNALVFHMVLDEALADDLTQEVFLRVVRHLGDFRGESGFSTWIARVAMNVVYSHWRRGRNAAVEFRSEPPDAAGPNPGPARTALCGELEDEIGAAIASLSPKLRAAIVLTTIEQMEVGEAAQVEGCSAATMYWRIHEARKQLRRRLESYLTL